MNFQVTPIEDILNIDFISEFNKAVSNANDSLRFLKQVVFTLSVSFNYKRIALEKLLEYIEYNVIADEIETFIQTTSNPYDKNIIIAIADRYRNVDSDLRNLKSSQALWKRGKLDKAISGFKELLVSEDSSLQEKLTCIHTMVNDCYNPEQKEAIAQLLRPIYMFLQGTLIAYASVRDILASIFNIRNIKLQSENIVIFREHINILAESDPHKAWKWVCDAIEFTRPGSKEPLWEYLCTWLTEPPFNETLPMRGKLKYQFFVCEFLLQSFRTDNVQLATNFLLQITESAEYSTFVRGDALDVLLRNHVPPDARVRIRAAREAQRVMREDAAANRILELAELGGGFADLGIVHFEPAIAGTTFDDSQSVHTTTVNQAINESILNLSTDLEVRGNTTYKVADDITNMINHAPNDLVTEQHRSRAKNALKRFVEDPAVFTEKRIKLGAVLVLVWNRIIKHTEKDELSIRLIQELSEAFNTCATGHLSRIVSVLIGFYSDIKQSISFETQLSDNIKAHLYAAVKNTPDDLQGDLLIAMADDKSPEYRVYLDFSDKLRSELQKNLLSEFVPQYMQEDTFKKVFEEVFPH